MAVLQSVDALRERLGFTDSKEVVINALERALNEATVVVGDHLRTGFDRQTNVDLFYVPKTREFGPANRGRPSSRVTWSNLESPYTVAQTRFALSQGFVDSGETITAYAASTVEGLADSDLRYDLKDVSGRNLVTFDYDEGVMIVDDFLLNVSYVQVSYTSGFTTTGGDPEVYVGQPNWLKTMCEVRAHMATFGNRVLYDDLQPGPDVLSILRYDYSALVDGHARYYPSYMQPMTTTATAI